MKLRKIIFALLFTVGIFAASCSQHTCPAYSHEKETNTETKV